MKILAIETSCDETAIAIIEVTGLLKKPVIHVLSNIVSSQIKLHAKFGGVVPNLARREHEKNLVPILMRALKESGFLQPELRIMKDISGSREKESSHKSLFMIQNSILNRESELLRQFEKRIIPRSLPDIDAIAVTYGPGLAPALWVGVNFARALSHLWKKPLIPVNHMEGHIVSALLKKSRKDNVSAHGGSASGRQFSIFNFQFPAMALLVSGGHTELVLIRSLGDYRIIGETLDDAAGEAFDKVARILGLGYPGGPAISQEVEKWNFSAQGSPVRHRRRSASGRQSPISNFQFHLPRPMLHSKDYNFSFSGLKTAVLYLVRDLEKKYPVSKFRSLVAKEFQNAVVEILVAKTLRAAKEYRVKTVLLGGGVAANNALRKILQKQLKKELSRVSLHLPDTALTGDNALMIAVAAALTGKKKAWTKVHADANVRLY